MSSTPLRRIEYTLQRTLDGFCDRMLRFDKVGFTHDEFLTMFAPPEHHDMLKEVRHIAHVSSSSTTLCAQMREPDGIRAKKVDVLFHLHGDDAPLTPKGSRVLANTPTHLLDRLTSRVNHEVDIRSQFSLAKAVMSWLDNNCDNLATIRFVWPSILTLLTSAEHDDRCQRKAEQVREFKTQRLPFLPPQIREACRLTSGTIAAASLLTSEDPKPFKAPVTFSVHNINAPVNWGPLGTVGAE